MAHYIGLDAHSKTCTAVVIDDTGKIQATHEFPTSEGNLVRIIKSVAKPRHLAFEEQDLAHWLFLTCGELADKVVVANPYHLPKHRGAKGDIPDALRLAEELRANRLVSVFHEESKLWNLRAIVNSYRDFTEDLVRSKNRYKALLRYRGKIEKSRTIYDEPALLESIKIEEERFVGQKLFEQIDRQQKVKDSYEEKFAALAKQWPVIKNLTSIPGISNIRASIIAAIICSAERFSNKHKLWAYCKLVRYIDISDGKIYGSRNAPGRSELKGVFVGAATNALQGTSSLRRFYDQLRSKGVCHNDAKRAVARRIAAIALMVMKTGRIYDDHHEEKKRRNNVTKS